MEAEKRLADVLCNIVSSEPGVSRTQLVKLAYLTDREYFKDHQKTLTGIDYILYFYGPYSHDFKIVLNSLKHKNILEEKYDGVSYHISLTKKGLGKVPNLEDEGYRSLEIVISLARNEGLLNSASAIKKYVYNLNEVKKTEPFDKIKLSEI